MPVVGPGEYGCMYMDEGRELGMEEMGEGVKRGGVLFVFQLNFKLIRADRYHLTEHFMPVVVALTFIQGHRSTRKWKLICQVFNNTDIQQTLLLFWKISC